MYNVRKYKARFWSVVSADGTLVCVCVYRKGAQFCALLLNRLTSQLADD